MTQNNKEMIREEMITEKIERKIHEREQYEERKRRFLPIFFWTD